jgi:hypothetical protein
LLRLADAGDDRALAELNRRELNGDVAAKQAATELVLAKRRGSSGAARAIRVCNRRAVRKLDRAFESGKLPGIERDTGHGAEAYAAWRRRRRPAGHAPRRRTNGRTRGSRRSAASSSQASRDGPADLDDEPPGVDSPTPGDRVRLDPGTAIGTVERVRGEVAEVRWATGARCSVPFDWIRVVFGQDAAPAGADRAAGGPRTPPLRLSRWCGQCGTELQGRADAQYCSSACKQAAHRQRQRAGR